MADNLWIEESLTNEERNCLTYKSEVYESSWDTIKSLFKSLQKEYGRCTGKIYIDIDNGGLVGITTMSVGWVFAKKVKYSDCKEYFTQNAWITVHEKEPETHTKFFYKEIN
jgi:hypothetical protein